MAQLTDEELAPRVQGGETHWFAFLVDRYEAKLSRYAKKFLFGRDDTQDLVQEIFIKAFTNLRSFDASRKFSPWIYRIAHNEFINAIKKRNRNPLNFFDPDMLFPHPVYESENTEQSDAELKNMLDTSLDKIDTKYREPLVLFYYEDMDYQSISEIMHIPISTVGIRLKRGKDALKKMVKNNPAYE
jgi:RNA polymerase sigma-70 factor (ECF subfamily)